MRVTSLLTQTAKSAKRNLALWDLTYQSRIDASTTIVHHTLKPHEKTPNENLVFGRTFSDHMLVIDWDRENGWQRPFIGPYGNLNISPAATSLHYGIQCFEGMKAYKDAKGQVRLFRPQENLKRLNASMTRLAMPELDQEGFLACMKQLLKLDESWIPSEEGYSLYIRPTAIGNSPFLGVHASEQVKLFVILSPVGPYYKSGFFPIKLYADTEHVRAWPGGVGNTKVGGNYGPSIAPSQHASALGCSQVLWLFGENHEITEVGAMNIFFLLKTREGGIELVTAPLTRGDILPGITRKSILELAHSWQVAEAAGLESPISEMNAGPLTVSERWVTMDELVTCEKEGRLLESFGTGTAVVISPVNCILYKGHEIKFPTGANAGPLSKSMWSSLMDIQYGRVDHEWSVVI